MNILDALAFANAAHAGQVRKDAAKSPYINHPIAVAQLLNQAGVDDQEILMAALLHDVIEDCGIKIEEIENKFGPNVALMVGEVSDDKSLKDYDRREAQVKKAAIMSYGAKLIKVADKIANLRDVVYNPPVGWDKAKKLNHMSYAYRVIGAAQIENEWLLDRYWEIKKEAEMAVENV